MTYKTCPKCGRNGPVAEMFGVRNIRHARTNGEEIVTARPQSYCYQCRATMQESDYKHSFSSAATMVETWRRAPLCKDEPIGENWKHWSLEKWNWRLLNHFFRRVDEHSGSVAVLLVTADELARATRDASAQALDVRTAFLEAVLTGIRQTRNLLEHASDYQGFPKEPPRSDAVPRFVAHLLFTCIAASESSEELGNEGQFLMRLRDLSNNQLPEHSLSMLPILWQHFAAWLQINSGQYRSLVLPDCGGLTRIGHTVKLAFPDRRDQKKLSEILDSAELSGHEPPIGRVLAVIGSARRSFSASFTTAFDDFRSRYESVSKQSIQRLGEHRFWAAVRDAALRGRGQACVSDLAIRVSFLAEDEEDQITLFAVADQHTDEATAFVLTELPIAYGQWQYALLPPDNTTLDVEPLNRIVSSILDGKIRIPRLSSFVDQGLLPFIVGTHGLLELASTHELLEDVSVALVRETLAHDLIKLIGKHTVSSSSYNGWVHIKKPRLRVLSAEEVEGTAVAKVWILQQSLIPVGYRFIGGVRVDDGWLGVAEVLPTLVAPGASRVTFDDPSGQSDLTELGEDRWSLPSKDLVGKYTVSITVEGATVQRTIRFQSTPMTETFKRASDLAGWITEGLRGTGTLEDQDYVDAPSHIDFAAYCERVMLLGPDVGEFVSNPDDAAWRLTYFASRLIGSQGRRTGENAIPRQQIDNAHARRLWRKNLFDCIGDISDPLFEQSRRQIKGTTYNRKLPRREFEQVVPDFTHLKLSAPKPSVERFVRVLAGRASLRAGIDWSEWAELAQRILAIDQRSLQYMTRAWMEAGLIDVASYARWRHRRIFARSPQLVAFRTGQIFGAFLMGLVLPKTLEDLQASANRLELLAEERCSVSSLVPRALALRAPSMQALRDFALSKHMPLRWIDLTALKTTTPRHDGLSLPPTHYERRTQYRSWSLTAQESSEVLVEHHLRRGRPEFWTASANGRGIWSYDLNIARCWAAALLSEPLVSAKSGPFLDAHHAFLPLSLARVISVIGGGLSGPIDGKYQYVTGTAHLRELVLDIISRVFNPSLLAARVAK